MSSGEKRRYPRLSLKIDDGIFAHFLLPGLDHPKLLASIMSLSAGGINVAVPAIFKDKIRPKDILLLKQVAGARNLAFLSDIQAEIRWIQKLEPTDYLSVGCKFRELVEPVRLQISQLVHSERMIRGQYG
jgi:c-di-GMP-binding flagellar brake protein YcgR